MKPTYEARHDGLQWVLYREADAEKRGEDRKPTGEFERKESVVGYFPKFHQAVGRMYEGMVADELVDFSGDELVSAVQKALWIYDNLKCKVVK